MNVPVFFASFLITFHSSFKLGGKMRSRGQLVFGAILVALGILSLISAVFHIDFGVLCWPLLLIGVGVWLVFRPRLSSQGLASEVLLLGERRRRGSWTVTNEEFWLGVGDVELDMTGAVIPPGETLIRFNSFVSDVEVFIPRAVGVAIHVNGFVIDSYLLGQDFDAFLTPVVVNSDNLATAECRVRIEMNSFVANLKVKQL
jgi:lia operon protein LiaF